MLPGARGSGFALALLSGVCAAARDEGAVFLRAGGFDRGTSTGRFYERVGEAHDAAECNLAGRAFRHLAELHGRGAREVSRSLPPREWNFTA